MVEPTLSEADAVSILRHELGGEWQISATMGTMASTRLARCADRSVAVKLIRTPAVIMERLSELEVTPPVIALGEIGEQPYMIQQAIDGERPDHAWFAGHRVGWAPMIRRYLQDAELTELLAARPGFWRLDVSAAVAMITGDLDRAPRRSPALLTETFGAALDSWREQANSVRPRPMRPIHPDAHWHNYVIDGASLLLLDWDYVDLSDPLRDVGSQVWSFLPRQHWTDFLQRVGVPDEGDLPLAICWWAGFKLLSNAIWNDRCGDPAGAAFHVNAFLAAAAGRAWLPL